jgi:hypothetical protein
MPREKQPTIEQHYISQVYLRGFSSNRITVCKYSIKENKHDGEDSIKNICKEENLYEFRDNNGNIIAQNKIEKQLKKKIEDHYNYYIELLEKKLLGDTSKIASDFFKQKEIDFWKMFASVQALRFPNTIQFFTDKLLKTSNGNLTKNEARNLILRDTVSSNSFMNPNAQSTYSYIYDIFRNLYISLFVDETASIFANDRVLSFGQTDEATKPNVVLLPITSKMVIVFYDKEFESEYGKNSLLFFESKELEKYKRCTTTDAEWIYSRKPLTDREIQILNERSVTQNG